LSHVREEREYRPKRDHVVPPDQAVLERARSLTHGAPHDTGKRRFMGKFGDYAALSLRRN